MSKAKIAVPEGILKKNPLMVVPAQPSESESVPEVRDFTSRTGTRYRLTIKDGIVMSIGPWSASETDPDMPLVGQIWPPRYAQPEVPEEIKDLLGDKNQRFDEIVSRAILEAYRRGKKAGSTAQVGDQCNCWCNGDAFKAPEQHDTTCPWSKPEK